MGSLHAPIHDLSRSLTPLSSIADSTDEVDRLLTGPISPERSQVDGCADEESDLSSLTSSDEEEDIDTTPRPIKAIRTLRPRGTKALTSGTEYATPSAQTSSLSVPSSSVEPPPKASKKRKRTESFTAKVSPAAQRQKPKLDSYVSEDRCHQCRNRPRYAFMRCTSKDESDVPCRRLFCVSCITKRSVWLITFAPLMILTDWHRYPTDIDFDPQLKKWKCPFCGDACNCTKCCFKRNVRYTSTANVKIDQDTLLYYAALMPNNFNSKKQPPPLPKSSKLTKKPKSVGKSKSKPPRAPTKAKPAAENNHIGVSNPTATRDIESIIRGLTETAAMFEKFGCVSGEYWGVVFSNIDGGRIGVAYVGDKLPDIFFLKDDDGSRVDEAPPPPAKRLRASSRLPA